MPFNGLCCTFLHKLLFVRSLFAKCYFTHCFSIPCPTLPYLHRLPCPAVPGFSAACPARRRSAGRCRTWLLRCLPGQEAERRALPYLASPLPPGQEAERPALPYLASPLPLASRRSAGRCPVRLDFSFNTNTIIDILKKIQYL